VIAGGFSDSFGHYVQGDCIEMDDDVEHQPVVDADGECIVLAAVEGRLRLRGWIGKLFQPLIGI
jgi:putative transcriptional regulator